MPMHLDLVNTMTSHGRDVNAVAFSRDDRFLASGGGDCTVRLWDVATQQLIHTMEHGEWVNDVAFAPSGQAVASVARDGSVKIWSVKTGQLFGAIPAHPKNATCLIFSPDGTRVVSGGDEGAIRVYNLREKKMVAGVNAHAGWVWRLAFTSIGDRLLSAGGDCLARVWRLGSKEKPIVLEGHRDEVLYASFSPDDRFVATASKDGAVIFWESESGRQVYSFQAHVGAVNSVNFSPDGIHLGTAGADKTVRIWQAESGQLVREIVGGDDHMAESVFSHDGTRMASCGGDGTVKIWEVKDQKDAIGAGEPPRVAASLADPTVLSGLPDGLACDSGTRLDKILSRAVVSKASDIHVPSGAPIQVRRNGCLERLDERTSPPEEIAELLLEILTEEQRKRFLETNDLDFSYEIKGVGRFRANVCRQHRGIDGSFRVIPDVIPSPEALGLPANVAPLTKHHQGLVLVTGPAGQGKSTTIATLVDLINSEKPLHIITVEDPIEFVHPIKCAVVNQREVGKHTLSFANALRAALREDPDVIVVGEMRDLETIALAITAAETGHLVFGSLMTTNAAQTVDRILDSFPAGQQGQIRTMLSESLKGIVSQQLVPDAEGKGRVLACELLLCNLAVANMIRERKTFQLNSVMQTSRNVGMQRMDDALFDLSQAGRITPQKAMMYAHDPKALEPRFQPVGAMNQAPRAR